MPLAGFLYILGSQKQCSEEVQVNGKRYIFSVMLPFREARNATG